MNASRSDDPPAPSSRAKRARAWIVDDSRADAEAVRAALADLADCEIFHDGSEMLERVVQVTVPDVIVLDWQLPDVTGIELCKFLREVHNEASLPVLMLTVISGKAQIAEALAAGANDYVAKPFDAIELRARVGAALRSKRLFDRTRAAEAALERERAKVAASESKFRRLADSGIIGIVQMDLAGVVTEANDAFLEMVGLSRPDLAAGRIRMRDLTPADSIAADEAALHELIQKGTCERYEKELIRSDGERISVLTGSAMLDRSERRTIAYMLDVTEQRRLEADKRRLYEAERRARNAAERASSMKDDFLATVSHELRTPLNAILGWSRIAQTKTIDPAKRDHALETIERNARAQARLINDILEISRIVSGKLRLDLVPTDLRAMIGQVVDGLRPAATAKNITLSHQSRLDRAPVMGDPDRLEQVVWNLVTNALKFTDAGGAVTVELTRRGGSFVIEVSDTGQGIEPDFLPHVFDRFRQADSSITRSHGGLGLGLSIVRNLVELHGGTVGAKSEGKGRGASFRVELPGMSADVSERPKDVEIPSARKARALEGVRILVVEDDQDSREFVCTLLEQHGADVAAVASSAAAMELLEKKPFDVLVSDIGMPGEDGFAFLRRLRSRSPAQGGDVRAIALTAYAREDDAKAALEAGFQAHLAKPVDTQTLLASITELCS